MNHATAKLEDIERAMATDSFCEINCAAVGCRGAHAGRCGRRLAERWRAMVGDESAFGFAPACQCKCHPPEAFPMLPEVPR